MKAKVRARIAAAERLDRGFTMIELIVAIMVITVVLLLLMALQTSALVTTVHAKQREQATAFGNAVLEELRTLPWSTLSKGLYGPYISAAADPNVVSGHLKPAGVPAIDEILKTSTLQAMSVPPLSGTGGTNVTTLSDPGGSGQIFTARSYVTTPTSVVAGEVQLTVIVTWGEAGASSQRRTVARSIAYSPAGGCGNPDTQPFLGACQAFFSAESSVAGASISIGAADDTGAGAPALPVIDGAAAYSATESAVRVGTTVSSQQAASAQATGISPGAATSTQTAGLAATGSLSTVAAASSDVGAAGASAPDSGPFAMSSGASPLAIVGSVATLTMTPGTTSSGSVRSSTTLACQVGVPLKQPCSNTTVTNGGTVDLKLDLAGGGSLSLVSAQASSAQQAWSARLVTSPGSGSIGCTVLSGAGCTSSGASRSLGTVAVGKGAATGPVAIDGLVSVTGYQDAVSSQLGAAQTALAPTVSRSGTVKYWNGTGYVTMPTLTKDTDVTVPGDASTGVLSTSWTLPGGTVTAVASLSIRKSSVSRTGSDPCQTNACEVTTEQPSVTVTTLYSVTVASVTDRFIVTTDLGTNRSALSYKAAPSA